MLSSSDLPTLTADGYIFEGWMISGTSSIVTSGTYKVTENVTLVAKWKDSTISSYSVKHYLQKTTCDGYDLDTTENLSGEIGKATSVSAKTYKGFTAKEITQETIKKDGSTIVSIYYDRNKITLSFDTDGGSQVESITGYYGTDATIPENPTKDDYVFTGWSVSNGTITELPSTFPSEDTTYTAVWKAFFYGNAVSAANYIKNLTEDETVCVTGELTEELLSDIASAIRLSSRSNFEF